MFMLNFAFLIQEKILKIAKICKCPDALYAVARTKFCAYASFLWVYYLLPMLLKKINILYALNYEPIIHI